MAKTKINFKQFQNFTKQFEKLAQTCTDGVIREMLSRLANETLDKAFERTPVDSGHLKGNWQIGEIKKESDTWSIEVINTAEYALYVEKGHRIMGGEGNKTMVGWRDGKFMLTIAEDEVSKSADKYVELRMKKFIKEHLKG